MTEVKLSIDYEQYEEGVKIKDLLEELAAKPESTELNSLIIGDWGGSYENDSSEIVAALTQLKDRFPNLRKLFIGDMGFEECEVSWIMQSNLTPILTEFPELESLTIKGSTGLEIEPVSHAKLQELVIICGGLGKKVLASISQSSFPQLKKLELYMGVEDYGFDGELADILPLIEQGKFPELTYLGLKNSELEDEIAIALADAPILSQLHTLDLSLGTLTDKGAEALLASDQVRKLQFLDLSYHYMSDDMVQRWQASGLSVDTDEQQDADEDEDYRYPSLTE
ncbi:STM4015 family protein [Paenibacillus sp. HWE-109]|uniref:STM4015 family protein n=1 Tax=Paenibacillus sp. HWE-109 TaxID=1306526 RepID=UPI001EDFCDEA|nr:STM4015 family protein [Paenibacillus sp. HWE-109]UKS29235.1 STM4015 family protein [Paenibacillus sp. HWE-109]